MFDKSYFNNQIVNTEMFFMIMIENIKKIYPDVFFFIGNSWEYLSKEEMMLPLSIYLTITPQSLINTEMQKEGVVLSLEIFDSIYENTYNNTPIMQHPLDGTNRICFHYSFTFSDGEYVTDPICVCYDFKDENILIKEILESYEKYNNSNFELLISALTQLEKANNLMNKN